MAERFPALVVLLIAFSALPSHGPAAASCAGPSLAVDSSFVLRRDEPTSVEGERFLDGCRDSMSCGVGCGGCEYDDPPPVPMMGVPLTLEQDGRSWPLGEADATDDGEVTWTVTLPDEVRRGRARLVVGDGSAVPVRVR